MGGVFGRQQRRNPAVHVHLVEMREVRVVALLAADRQEEEQPALLVDAQQLRDVAFAAGDLALQLAGLQVVEIELAPVVALGEPDDFVRCGQVAPVDAPVARLEEGRDGFLEHVADAAGRRIRHAQRRLLVVSRRRDERDALRVGRPLHVGPVAAAAREVVAQRRAMLVGIHLESDHLRGIHVDDDPLDHRHHVVTREWILPGLQLWMARLGADEIHFADLALVLLERRDLLRVGRPHHDWPVAAGPPGVVGRVSEILHAVRRQRGFLAGGGVADPEVPIADEDGAFAVRRRHIISDRASSAAARRRARRTSAAAAGGAGRQIARRLRRP